MGGFALDADDNLFLAVNYHSSNFDPGDGAHLPHAGNGDLAVVSFDAAGNFNWAAAVGGPAADQPVGIAVGPDGRLYFVSDTGN